MDDAPAARPPLPVQTVVADDGTSLGYRSIGTGPGIVVLHGAMSTGLHHVELAYELAADFTVLLPDRRGRGLSGPRRPADGLDRDAADLLLLLRATGARDVVAVSSGAIVALAAASGQRRDEQGEDGAGPGASGQGPIRRLVLNEPPLIAADRARALSAKLDHQLRRGDLPGALVTGMKGAELGPAFLNRVPDRLLAVVVRLAMNRPPARDAGYPTMAELAPTLAADFRVAAEQAERGLERFAGLSLPVTCVLGADSPRYLRDGMRRLSEVIPGARLVELPDTGHEVSWNRDLRGDPARLAEVVRQSLR